MDKTEMWPSDLEINWQEWSSETEMAWLRAVIREDSKGRVTINHRNLDWFYGGLQKLSAMEGGRKGLTILAAIFLCCLLDRPLPEIVKMEFCLRFARGHWGRVRSWDEAFGRPPETRAKMKRQFRDRFLPDVILKLVAAAQEEGTPVDNMLFEKIGRELGIGGRETTRKLYSAAQKRNKKSASRRDTE